MLLSWTAAVSRRQEKTDVANTLLSSSSSSAAARSMAEHLDIPSGNKPDQCPLLSQQLIFHHFFSRTCSTAAIHRNRAQRIYSPTTTKKLQNEKEKKAEQHKTRITRQPESRMPHDPDSLSYLPFRLVKYINIRHSFALKFLSFRRPTGFERRKVGTKGDVWREEERNIIKLIKIYQDGRERRYEFFCFGTRIITFVAATEGGKFFFKIS